MSGTEAPTHAASARRIVEAGRVGTLSTLAREPAGHPFGSLVSYAVSADGAPVVLISRLAEHTANLAADGRASLLVVESVPGGDPLAGGRVTLLGDAVELGPPTPSAGGADPVQSDVRARFLAVHPEAAAYVDFPDFSFWRLAVRDVRYVGGFGRMSWVEVGAYLGAG